MLSAIRVAAIASNTVREAVRSRVLYVLLFFAVTLMLFGIVLSSLSYVESERILQDVAMAAMRVFGVAIAIFVGVNLIHKEVDRRTVYTILSKPLTRAEFLFGKFAGLVLTIWLQLAIMVACFMGVSALTGAEVGAGHAAAFVLLGGELALIVAVATLFSSFSTPLLSSFFTAGVWLAGHLTRDLRDVGLRSNSEWVGEAGVWLHRMLPDLQSFNLTIEAVHGLPVTAADVWLPLVYGAAYTTLLLLAATLIFDRRDFR
ncbi:MAG: ABC transporter permease [Deltaproteobacteria bacterium]|nr:ABC transporter permease [Deltaproteobacteria bacterium]MBW2360369.1 ABC transporter permease [Deltaproteobacteria bacterium]